MGSNTEKKPMNKSMKKNKAKRSRAITKRGAIKTDEQFDSAPKTISHFGVPILFSPTIDLYYT